MAAFCLNACNEISISLFFCYGSSFCMNTHRMTSVFFLIISATARDQKGHATNTYTALARVMLPLAAMILFHWDWHDWVGDGCFLLNKDGYWPAAVLIFNTRRYWNVRYLVGLCALGWLNLQEFRYLLAHFPGYIGQRTKNDMEEQQWYLLSSRTVLSFNPAITGVSQPRTDGGGRGGMTAGAAPCVWDWGDGEGRYTHADSIFLKRAWNKIQNPATFKILLFSSQNSSSLF